MRCQKCDVELTDFEATRKRIDVKPRTYVDLCNSCFACVASFMAVSERWDLFTSADVREPKDSRSDNNGENEDLFEPYSDEFVDDFVREKEDG